MFIWIFSLVGLLFLIWPIPHTVSIREILLIGSTILSIIYIYKQKASLSSLSDFKIPGFFYLIFLAWVIFIAFFISNDRAWALRELKSQWLWGSLALMLGGLSGVIIKDKSIHTASVMTILFFALVAHAAAISIDGFSHSLINDFNNLTYTTRLTGGLTIGPIDASVLCDFLLITVLAEWFYRRTYKSRMLLVADDILVIAFILALTGSVFCGLRNIVELTGLLVLVPMVYSRKSAMIAFATLASLAVFFYETDSRWSEIGESYNLASATDYDWNVEYKNPTIEPLKGHVVNASNYLRLEKYDTGMGIIRANYFGVGYGRNAFGHGISNRYEKASSLNSDSSLFDLFIGTGIIGGILWLCFYVSLFYIVLNSFKNNRDFASCFLILLLVTFGARMMIDSIFRDHLMQMFLFMAGFFFSMRKEVL